MHISGLQVPPCEYILQAVTGLTIEKKAPQSLPVRSFSAAPVGLAAVGVEPRPRVGRQAEHAP
jgi:hypothetical protein